MITEYRKKHIFAVAELMQRYGQERNYPTDKCNELYTLGLLHDIGYAFLLAVKFCGNKDINFGKKFIITEL